MLIIGITRNGNDIRTATHEAEAKRTSNGSLFNRKKININTENNRPSPNLVPTTSVLMNVKKVVNVISVG